MSRVRNVTPAYAVYFFLSVRYNTSGTRLKSFCLQALSVFVYVFQAQRLSVCSHVRADMTADAGAGVEIENVDPGFVGTTKVVADSREYTAGGCCEREVSECSAPEVGVD